MSAKCSGMEDCESPVEHIMGGAPYCAFHYPPKAEERRLAQHRSIAAAHEHNRKAYAYDRLTAEVERLRKVLEPFAEFARRWQQNPIRGLGDELYSIHGGTDMTDLGASLRLSDCIAAKEALEEKS